jgi:hypothetical protein
LMLTTLILETGVALKRWPCLGKVGNLSDRNRTVGRISIL